MGRRAAAGLFRVGIGRSAVDGAGQQRVLGIGEVEGGEQVAGARDGDGPVTAAPAAVAELVLRHAVQLDGCVALPLEVGVPAVPAAPLQEPEHRLDGKRHQHDERTRAVQKRQPEDAERTVLRAPNFLWRGGVSREGGKLLSGFGAYLIATKLPIPFAFRLFRMTSVSRVGASLGSINERALAAGQ